MKTINVIEAIFFAALEKKDAGERADYLDKACVGDADLRRCVEKLLNAQPKVGNFMRAPAEGLPQTTDTPSDERPGTVLGPYKLLHDIGEGGMGTVWMAEQTDPVKRRVALKVIKPGMDSRQVLARFEAERQALALMDHPNIAKVLDAGATDTGRPYFVMELVKGQPITEFCDKNRLTPRERLELFVPVCHAIQHAHQKGVIHRDIKPTNVLVALYDGKPVPKVIDFGVAKATAEPLTDKTLFTRHGQVVGTFEYMSPEQATLDQVDVDTRSDVYSLGVLLYELLTGTTPLEKVRLRQAGLAEVLRLIREEEPPKPSTRLTSSPGLLAMAAAFRKSDSQKLPRVVRGELDWIVMKALDKDRDRRFVTPNGLARDIERYLKGEEVTACPPTLAYRFRKWAGKHKVALATGTTVAAALVVGTVLSSWQAVRATTARRDTAEALGKAAAERDAAIQLGKQLDTRLGEIKAANEKIDRDQKEMRRNQYAWDIRALPAIWEAGNTSEARRLHERQERELRGFEWHFWNRQMHSEAASARLPGLPESYSNRPAVGPNVRLGPWQFSADGARIAHLTDIDAVAPLLKASDKPTLLVWDVATRKLLPPHSISFEASPGTDRVTRSGSLWLSADGKRAAVTASLSILVPAPELGEGFGRAELRQSLLRVIDVDSGAVCFDSGKLEGEAGPYIGVMLSGDGRRLITHERITLPPLMEGGRPRFSTRSALWDLDAAEKKPLKIAATTLSGFSPDSSRVIGLAVADGGVATTKIWDAVSGKELLSLPRMTGVIYSPKGTYLAATVTQDDAAGEDKDKSEVTRVRLLKVFDASTGKLVSSTPLTGVVNNQLDRGFGETPYPLRFSPDESLIAVAQRPTAGNRVDWYFVEPSTGAIKGSLEDPETTRGPSLGFRDLSSRHFSADGSLFICEVDNAVFTFEAPAGRPVHTFRGHVNSIAAASTADEKHLSTIEADGTLKEWSLKRPAPPAQLAVVELPDRKGPDGSGFSSVSQQNLRGYKVSTGGEWAANHILTLGRVGKPDTVQVWNLAGTSSTIPTILEAPPRTGTPAAKDDLDGGSPLASRTLFISADGRLVAMSRFNLPRSGRSSGKLDSEPPPPKSDVIVWDVPSRKVLRQFELSPGDGDFGTGGMTGFSANGTTIVLTRRETSETIPNPRFRSRTRLWTIDVETGREGPTIAIDGNVMPASARLSPDGKRYAGFIRTAAADGTWNDQFAVWDLVSGAEVFSISPAALGGDSPGESISGPFFPFAGTSIWSPDSSRLAVLNARSATISLFDAATGNLIRTLNSSTRGITVPGTPPRIAFSPDGQRIAWEIRRPLNATISVLETESGKEVLSLPVPPLLAAQGATFRPGNDGVLTFSPDGRRLHFFAPALRRSKDADGNEVSQGFLRMHTWDATPLPEPK